MKRFTKSDLKSGDRVELRSGVVYIVLKDTRFDVMLFSNGCYNSTKLNEDLFGSRPESDIIRVFSPVNISEMLDIKAMCNCIWERPTYSSLFDYIEASK
jgi:hypothetical protein